MSIESEKPASRDLEKLRRKMDEKLDHENGWYLPSDLFPDSGADFYDFDFSDYVNFLNIVSSHEDLIKGLESLSPFADDALAIAQKMTGTNFRKFKEALTYERSLQMEDRDGKSKMPHQWLPIIMPGRFIQAALVAEQFEVCLGISLIRLTELEAEDHFNQELYPVKNRG